MRRYIYYIKNNAKRCRDVLASYYKKIKKHITPRRAGIIGVIILAAAVFAMCAVRTYEEEPEKELENIKLVTRVPFNGMDMLLGKKTDSAIYLSWYDNSIKLKKDEETKLKLGAVMYPVTIKDRGLSYESSDRNAAEIDGEGNIIAKNPGSVEITVKNDYTGNTAKAFLQIIQPVTGFYLQKSTINLYTTDMSMRLNAVVLPENASNAAIRWYSKDSDIVEVDQTGHLKPKNTGMTEIVATASDGGMTAKCFVNVINEIIKAASVTILNKEDITLNIGETWTGIASVLPANAKNTTVEWESSDTSVATVSKTGIVKAVAEGTAVMTAKNADGPKDTVEIKVTGGAPNTELDMNPTYSVMGGINYTAYSMTLEQMTDKTAVTNPTYNDGSGLKSADKNRIRMYLDPNEFCKGAYKYQFMDLSHYNGVSRDVLNRFLEGKGALSGQADAFISAAREYNVSELYLVAHACVETGYGTSALANGINVNGTRVYNMYGIGALDYNAAATGSHKAYSEGWTSPAIAIKEGARWISEHYINAGSKRQNTLYKMRWNPDNPGTHLYAGDVAWAVSQASIMEKLFEQFPGASAAYEIPVYAGSNAAEIDEN